MNPWDQFTGANAGYVYELFERYQRDASSVDEATRRAFATWTPADPSEPVSRRDLSTAAPSGAEVDAKVAIAAFTLAGKIRRFGHLAAQLDPLGFHDPIGDPSLSAQSHHLSTDALKRLPASIVSGPAAAGAANAFEAIARLREIYCSTTGHDYSHVFVPDERAWLRQAVESGQFRPPVDPINSAELLDRITQIETFERFLHRTFPGKTRFSIEGLDMMVPIIDEIIHDAAEGGVQHVMIAMAHRGRLNVLAHILQKPYTQILAEFKDPIFSKQLRVDLGWMGDVKYHAGARIEAQPDGLPKQVVISMPPNPSHLEAVDPLLNGMARAAATSVGQAGPAVVDKGKVLAILIHGDSAFPGQGVVAETLNLSRLDGYDVGGIIHIIANNQLGFTTDPDESFSTSYASGLARGFKIPITHVNADDPVACIEAARLAIAYRQRFKLDYLIDLVGYRRYGHNEGDEPAFTQPAVYQIVSAHPTVREQYVRALVEAGQVSQQRADEMVRERMTALEQAYADVKPEQDYIPPVPAMPPSGAATKAKTAMHSLASTSSTPPCCRCPRASPFTASLNAVASGARPCSLMPANDRSTGRPPKNWRWPRSWPMALRFGSPAKTLSAAPSATATPCTTTPSLAKSTCRCSASPRPGRPSKFATARCPSTPVSASSWAITCRSQAGWSCGKRSTATSSTAPRSSSTST